MLYPYRNPDSVDISMLREAISQGDTSVLYTFYNTYGPLLYGRIADLVEPTRAPVVLEKTFLYAIRHIDQYNPRLRMQGWLLQIAGFKILKETIAARIGKDLPDSLGMDDYSRAWSFLIAEEKEALLFAFYRYRSEMENADIDYLGSDLFQERLSAALHQLHHYLSEPPC